MAQTVVCPTCGKEFRRNGNYATDYCSAECDQRDGHRLAGYTIERQCAYCGKPFYAYQSGEKSPTPSYCSDECGAKSVENFHARRSQDAQERTEQRNELYQLKQEEDERRRALGKAGVWVSAEGYETPAQEIEHAHLFFILRYLFRRYFVSRLDTLEQISAALHEAKVNQLQDAEHATLIICEQINTILTENEPFYPHALREMARRGLQGAFQTLWTLIVDIVWDDLLLAELYGIRGMYEKRIYDAQTRSRNNATRLDRLPPPFEKQLGLSMDDTNSTNGQTKVDDESEA